MCPTQTEAQPNQPSPFSCTRQDRRFCAVRSYQGAEAGMWRLNFDIEDDGLEGR